MGQHVGNGVHRGEHLHYLAGRFGYDQDVYVADGFLHPPQASRRLDARNALDPAQKFDDRLGVGEGVAKFGPAAAGALLLYALQDLLFQLLAHPLQ